MSSRMGDERRGELGLTALLLHKAHPIPGLTRPYLWPETLMEITRAEVEAKVGRKSGRGRRVFVSEAQWSQLTDTEVPDEIRVDEAVMKS